VLVDEDDQQEEIEKEESPRYQKDRVTQVGHVIDSERRQIMSNINTGIALLQMADEGLEEIENHLQKMLPLTNLRQGFRGYNQPRSMEKSTVQHLLKCIDKIAETTEYQGHKLLGGKLDFLVLSVGFTRNKRDSYNLPLGELHADTQALNLRGVEIERCDSRLANNLFVDRVQSALGQVSTQRERIHFHVRQFDDSLHRLLAGQKETNTQFRPLPSADGAERISEDIAKVIAHTPDAVGFCLHTHLQEIPVDLISD